MKPNKAVQIGIDSDISVAAIVNLQDDIRKKMDDSYKKEINYTLKVASQSLSEAIVLSYSLGYSIEIDFTYQPDEWSLMGTIWNFKEKPYRTDYEIWSPGA